MLSDRNDYPLSLPRHALRSALFRAGLTRRLGQWRWPVVEDAAYIKVDYRKTVRMFDGMPTEFENAAYSEVIKSVSAHWNELEDRITAVEDCLVEPNRCLIIGPDGALVHQSIPARLIPLFPSAVGYALRGRPTRLAKAYVHDGFASNNFYHHVTDAVTALLLFQEHGGEPADIPVIVARWIYESRFFADLRLRSAKFAAVNWRVQEPGEWLHVDRAYLAHAAPFDAQRLQKVRELYPKISEPNGRRVFLSRDRSLFSRGLRNEKAVSELLTQYGFKTCHFEHLSLEQQQVVMEESEFVVALHGMALVQELFMDPTRAHVLELMPANRFQAEFCWLGWARRLQYCDIQAHSDLGADGHYEADLILLEAGVRRMLDAPADRHIFGLTDLGALSDQMHRSLGRRG